ncbi:MAG TPA: heavy-metal-associated domain-containing protein [Burkholderiales bacterium]|nr:heavy-metal-associated domain-containing protein [Burkholderiales bacterium]
MKMQESWNTQPRFRNAVVTIRGMATARCASSVASALGLVPGVGHVEVFLEQGQATVSFDPRKADPYQFCVAVRAVGFKSEVIEEPMAA